MEFKITVLYWKFDSDSAFEKVENVNFGGWDEALACAKGLLDRLYFDSDVDFTLEPEIKSIEVVK